MIVVTHAMGFARNVAHNVHVMHAGRVADRAHPLRSSTPRSSKSRASSWQRLRHGLVRKQLSH